MELSEKLQELRRNRGLTQEELAEALYVSRTAVSKWESGRGTPSIDSLKELSRFFSVSIDELLSGEALVQIAENENRSNLRSVCELLFGIVDLLGVCLVLLPLYPEPSAGQVYAVSLFSYTQAGMVSRLLHWVLSLGLFGLGGAKVLLEGEFTAEALLDEVRTLLSDASRCEAMGKSMLSLSYQNAAERIAARILSLAKVPERNEGEENR